MATTERLVDFPSKPSPVPADIVYVGDSADGFNEVQCTIEQIINAYPSLFGIAGLTLGANSYPYVNSSGDFTAGVISALAVTLLADTTTTAMQTTIGLEIGTNVQAWSAALDSIAGLTTAADEMIYTTAPDTYATTALTSVARTMLAQTTNANILSTIGALPLAGGTMSGVINMNSNIISNLPAPTNPGDAVNKAYADAIASGITVQGAVYAATTGANLNATYSNGVSGVGATLTNAGALAAFSLDSTSPPINSRILVKDQSSTFQNGIYTLTTVGSGAVAWILTRATDYDSVSEIQPGDLVVVNNGTVNASSSWLQTATVATIGTDPILFSQFTYNPSAFLLKANNLSDLLSASTARTNLGLGTAAVKTASDNAQTNLASVVGAITAGHLAVFADTSGSVQDGGAVPASVVLPNSFATGRLTLTTGVPVTTSDVTAATTIYYTPYVGNYISLYDGSTTWNTLSFTQLSIAVPNTANTIYDVFCYNNSGTPTLELTAWTNDTTRATALIYQDGVYVKTGATTRRFLGSFRTTGSSGQTEDSLVKRYVWNYYNRVVRSMIKTDTGSWTYSTASFRQANGNAANQLDFVIGVSEDAVWARLDALGISSGATSRNLSVGIGLDSTTVNSATETRNDAATVSFYAKPTAQYVATIAIGRHTLVWLEKGGGADTQSWYAGVDGNGVTMNAGLNGWIKG